MFRWTLGIALAGCAAKQAPAEPATQAPEPTGFERADELAALLDQLADEDRWFGSVYLSQNGEPRFAKGVGHADAAGTQPVDPDTAFRIGSITKTYTATMVFQLVDEGALTLDTPLSTFYEGIPHGDTITIEQMLDHHSGIASITEDPTYATWMHQPATQQAMLERLRGYEPAFEPGAAFAYSNSNYLLLGYLVEALDQRTYAESLAARILEPIGATRTRYAGPDAPNEAVPLHHDGTTWSSGPSTHLSVPGGAGGIVSTPAEVCAFAHALFTGTLTTPASLATMVELHDNFGHGVFPMPFYDRIAMGHNGGIDTYGSMLGYFRDDGTCMAIATHTSLMMPINDLALATLSAYYDKPYTLPALRPAPTVPADTLEAYVGTYASDAIPLEIDLTVKDDQLWAQATGQSAFPLTPTSDTVFEFRGAGIRIEFDGEDGFVLHQGAAYPYRRKP